MKTHSEIEYPITFRHEDARSMGTHILHRHTVELIGMNRVGISNFLHFLLYHPKITETYISNKEKHLFITVDLNDLVELEMVAFWTLTFKRIIDAIEPLPIDKSTKERFSHLFVRAIQIKDTFFLFEGIRESINELTKAGFLPTIFYIRFDRFKSAMTPQLIANLQGLQNTTAGRLAYVFTSYRDLPTVSPNAYSKRALVFFSHRFYLKPANPKDSKIIFDSLRSKYKLDISSSLQQTLLEYSSGHVQYIQLSAIILNELHSTHNADPKKIIEAIVADERINLLSEEIWESLSFDEQQVIRKVRDKERLTIADQAGKQYLWDTGLLVNQGKSVKIFNIFFEDYIKRIAGKKESVRHIRNHIELTKKEHALFKLLESKINDLCERDEIIEKVWPEYSDLAVSDWTIDRLVSRLRSKLEDQKSDYTIVTVKTRGFKMVKK